jgi:exodeoxyribonuclease-3
VKIATWNVNSVRSRADHIVKWLTINEPDLLCLQETKVVDEEFPVAPFEEAGYTCHFHGQPSYNGVAFLARGELTAVERGFAHLSPEDELNSQARMIAGTMPTQTGDVRVVCVYVPNGEEVDSPKFEFKLRFMEEFRRMLDERHEPGQKLLVCGDFNVTPEEIDLHNPDERRGLVLFSEPEIKAYNKFCDFGLTDLFRRFHPEEGRYSWWDYRAGMFWKKLGMRIDFMLATEPLSLTCEECEIDERPRRWPKPSDHTIVVADFK